MNTAMAKPTHQLVHNIQNAVLGYTQSDEISILLNDWKTLETDQWFGNSLQKMVSVSASMATVYFNQAVRIALQEQHASTFYKKILGGEEIFTPGMFDARIFNLPKEEVANYFIWRQQDASRNSVQMLGRHYFSHREMHEKNVSNIQDMLMEDHCVNWNDLATWKKRGTCVTRCKPCIIEGSDLLGREGGMRSTAVYPTTSLVIDKEIPIFTQDRDYIEQLLLTGVPV